MQRLQQSHWIAAVLVVIAGTSVADVRGTVPANSSPRDNAGPYPACAPFVTVPADSKSELVPWNQRLSLAGCRPTIVPARVSDPERFAAMIANLEFSEVPSIAIYRDAMTHGPTQIRLAAAYDLGMTYVSIIVRARTAVRVADSGMFGGKTYGGPTYLEKYQAQHRSLEPLLLRQRDAGLAAFDEVARLASVNPAAASANAMLLGAVADARDQAELLRRP